MIRPVEGEVAQGGELSLDAVEPGGVRRGVGNLDVVGLGPVRDAAAALGAQARGEVAWRMVMDYAETRSLARHLGTAAFLVVSYLTGIRPHEALGMRAGCCPDPAAHQGPARPRHLTYSREYKTAVDEEGNHLEAGAIREVPWVAIAPVVCAIRQLERMVPDGALLFDSKVHDHVSRPRAGAALKTSAMHARIADFTAWANTEARRHGLDGETIPPDPLGPVTPSRLRRTLAWHIARRPGGLVALAIQYGHLRTGLTPLEVTGGYASRTRGGIHELIDIETVLATAEIAAALREAFDSGGGISGPAARAALHAAAGTSRFEGQQVKADYARKYLARDGHSCFAVLGGHVSAAAQAGRTARVSSGCGW